MFDSKELIRRADALDERAAALGERLRKPRVVGRRALAASYIARQAEAHLLRELAAELED